MGITNELFQQEREQEPACQFATVPNDVTDPEITTSAPAGLNAIEKFAFFQRFLAPPTPSPDTPGGARPRSTTDASLFTKHRLRPLPYTDAETTGNSRPRRR